MRWKKLALDYGMVFVLLALGAGFSAATVAVRYPVDEGAARALARRILAEHGASSKVLLATRDSAEDTAFAKAFRETLVADGGEVVGETQGTPADARRALEALVAAGSLPAVIAGPQAADNAVFKKASLVKIHPDLAAVPFVHPPGQMWPVFLTRGNLLNVATQIVVIAVIAIGMTMVIITAGIDLSVGSLIALSACVVASVIHLAAGEGPTSDVGMGVVLVACIAAVGLCGLIGMFSGVMLTVFHIPAFIVTLAVMLVARGLAYKATGGQALGSLPDSFAWLGHYDVGGIPVSVILMVLFYAGAYVLMNYSRLGRYIYAVGGNLEAARLSGVPVNRVLVTVYTVCGLLAGLGGIIMGSELKTGDPKTGQLYELYVIAAVVVGGTSLAGGQGRILGTLIGAFIIGVVRNGMNLTNVKPFNQYIVFGGIILLAVLLEKLKERVWADKS
jgi:ribose transport system permease protein